MSIPTVKPAVLVTGAAGGIGSATVDLLLARGYRVFAGVRSEPGGLERADVDVLPLDVSDPAAVKAAAERISTAVGSQGLAAVVNNAGTIVQGPLEIVPPDELRRQFEVCTFGPSYVVQELLPLLRASGRGRVVNVSAPTANTPLPFLGPISASKAALASLSEALRGELAAWRIPVSLVEPDTTDTPIFAKAETSSRRALHRADPARLALYQEHLPVVERAMSQQKPRPVAPVARAIVHAVDARRPRRRYSVGPGARALLLLSQLPPALRERMVARTLGLHQIEARP